ncbi:MAG: GDP-L-fucose synthase [bacterium]
MNDIILVTGSSGLVGSALKLIQNVEMIFLTRKDGDLRDPFVVNKIFKRFRPRKVIHLAASVGGVKSNMRKSADYFFDNMMINLNVFKAAHNVGTEKILAYMSTCVFPDAAHYPLSENQLHNGPPHESNFGYAYAKRMIEVQARAYRKQYGMRCVVAIPANIYGPHDNFDLQNGHVLPAIIHRMYLAKRLNSSITVWGSGKPLREFVFSKDIARLSIWAMENYNEESPIIFSSGKEDSIRTVVEVLCTSMQFEGEVLFDETQPDGQHRKPSDGSRLGLILPNFSWTNLEEGLKSTVSWFTENFKSARGVSHEYN